MKKIIILTGAKRHDTADTLDIIAGQNDGIEWLFHTDFDWKRNPFERCTENTKLIKIYHIDRVSYLFAIHYYLEKGIFVVNDNNVSVKIDPVIIAMCTSKVKIETIVNFPQFTNNAKLLHCVHKFDLNSINK